MRRGPRGDHSTRAWIAPVAVLAIAGLAYAVYGRGFVGFDAMYTLVWGREMSLGHLPEYGVAPTPHPLPNLVGLILAPLGSGAQTVLLAISYLAAGVLVWSTWLIGSRLFGAAAGAVAGVLLFSRDVVTFHTPLAFLDLPFAALVAAAIAMEVAQPRRGRAVLVVLAVAGTIRPEAWFLSGMYWLWLLPDLTRRDAIRLVTLVAAAPIVWMAGDLIVTGRPLFSFTGTTEAAAAIPGGAAGLADLISQGPGLLVETIRRTVVLAAGVGLVLALVVYRREAVRAAAIAIAVTLAFAIPAAAGTVVQARYAIPTIAMVCVFAGAAVGGWQRAPALRRTWMAAAVPCVLALCAGIPGQLDRVRLDRQYVTSTAKTRQNLERLVESGRIPCEPVVVPNGRLVPVVATWRQIDTDEVVNRTVSPGTRRGTFLFGTTKAMTGLVVLPSRDGDAKLPRPPSEARTVRTGGGWTMSASC